MPNLVTNIVDGKHGEENVCSTLKEKYESLLQGSPTDTDVITKLTNTIHNDLDFGNTPDYINRQWIS